jgi:PAS domain S-box-containing protein
MFMHAGERFAVAFVMDMRARRQVQAALQESEQFAKVIADNIPGVLGYWNRDLRCTFANKGYLTWFGRTVEQMQGIQIQEFLGDELFQKNEPHIRAALRGENSQFERMVIKPNGEIVYIWTQYIAHHVGDEVHGFFALVTDLTTLKQAQAALIVTETRFRTVIDVSPVPMGMNDGQQNITFLNPAFVQTFGYTQAMIPTLTDWWANAYPDPQYRQWVTDTWDAKLEHMRQSGGAFSPIEVTVRCNDGTSKIVLASAALISNDVADDHLVVLYDITAQKQAEAVQAKLEAQLYQSQKMESIGRLAGGVAHDFNNMLSVILGHTELALDEIDPSLPIHVDLVEIWKAAQRSANLTRQLLAFARKQAAAPKVLDLNETVAGTLTMLDRMIGENIDLVWKPAIDLWSVKIDPTQIDQILANLCVNARDAIANIGQITIETGNRIFDAEYCIDHTDCIPGEYVLLSVRDNGCGMSQDIQEHLFEPFFTTKPLGQGTGLGLATVYGIVKQNNGFIHVASELSQGTTFQIYLPRYSVTGVAAADTRVVHATLGGGETILLVEDEPAILKLASTMLTRLGYRVMTAGTPSMAIQIAETHIGEIHLLMTDVVMPEMNGRNLAAHLLARHPRLKRLFMSGYTDEIIAHHGVLEEGVFFIQKPFSMKDLATKVREVIEYGKANEAPLE